MTTLQGMDPRTGRPVGPTIAPTTIDELHQHLQAAGSAAVELADWSEAKRAHVLRSIATRLDTHANELVGIAEAETGLGAARLHSELSRTVGQLRLFADVVVEGSHRGATIDLPAPASDYSAARPDSRRHRIPVGPVAVWSGGNFPFAFSVAGGDTASALAAGCPVVVKAHSSHPWLSLRTGELIQDALVAVEAPAGAHAVVFGQAIGTSLIDDPRIRAGAFTGSLHVGRLLFDRANARPDPIPFYGELGSLNPVFITEASIRARSTDLAAGLAQSFTLGAGQFCTKPGIVFAADTSGLFATEVAAAVSDAAHPFLNRRIAESFAEISGALAGLPATEHLPTATGSEMSEGWWARPVVLRTNLAAFLADRDRFTTECFGPLTIVVEVGSDGELLVAAGEMPGGLTATIHAEESDYPDLGPLVRAAEKIAGRVVFNGWPTGVPVGWATQHGGPYPATTAAWTTAVGADAITRFMRPVAFQDFPDSLLPASLQDANPEGLPRRVNGGLQCAPNPHEIGTKGMDND